VILFVKRNNFTVHDKQNNNTEKIAINPIILKSVDIVFFPRTIKIFPILSSVGNNPAIEASMYKWMA